MLAKENASLRIRLPPSTKEWLTERAKENCRSVTGEIVYRLEEARKGEAPAAGSASQA